jgi:CAAX protease family protein
LGLSPDNQPSATRAPAAESPGVNLGAGRHLRAYALFLAAVFYYFVARSVAHHSAQGLAGDLWSPLLEQAMLVFLLLVGYSALGYMFQRQTHPIRTQGLPRREGWPREFGMGLAAGWGVAVVCVLPMVVIGGIAITLSLRASEWGWLLADAAFFLLAALAEELAFRGYPFQRFVDAVGPFGAVVGFSLFYAIVQSLVPGSSRVSFVVSVMLGILLSTAYLRTRALWVSWGINFGWKASRALLFGLVVAGVGSHSSVVEGDPMGPFWLTGGGFGLDGTWIAFFVLLAAIPVMVRMTRDLDFEMNAPVIVPGGIPVDLDAAARAQHDAAMGNAPAPQPLVQIAPVASPPQPAIREERESPSEPPQEA